MQMNNFINEDKILDLLERTKRPSNFRTKAIIKKSIKLKGLSPSEVAVLLNCEDEVVLNIIFTAARRIKELVYGNRLVLFAPLYLSNRCINNCLYCGFRHDALNTKKRLLKNDEIREETKALISQGHKRLLLVSAEEPAVNIDYLEDAIKTIYNTKEGNGDVRRINVNVAPMGMKDFKRLKNAGIGTYQLFQETYHRETYNQLHASGPKSDYIKRLYACDLAQSAGIDDVGIGALFGLYN